MRLAVAILNEADDGVAPGAKVDGEGGAPSGAYPVYVSERLDRPPVVRVKLLVDRRKVLGEAL